MIDRLGPVPLFLGVETLGWQLSTFTDATNKAKALGVTSLLVKIADGGNQWYGALGGWQKVLDAISKAGLKAVPYTYSYGNHFNAIDAEIAILKAAMQYAGIVVADMEVEWNGQTLWAHQLSDALKPVPGVFGVTTWANPNQQDWTNVLLALSPCTNFWMPQVYDNYLAGVYQAQYAGYNNVIPVLNLGTDIGPNDILSIAQNAKSDTLALWWYQPAINAYASTVQQLAKLKEGSSMGVPTGWHDANGVLTAPNNIQVVMGFRDYVLNNNWDSNNWPLEPESEHNPVEESNPALGQGARQTFRWKTLEYTPSRGVFEGWTGQELMVVRAQRDALQASQKSPVIANAANALGSVINTLQDVKTSLSS